MSLELNRRDLLKFFGIGATIVPVIGGAVKTELPARLIEEAKVEPILAQHSMPPQPPSLNSGDTWVTIDDGERPYRFRAMRIDIKLIPKFELIDVSRSFTAYREYMPGQKFIDFTIEGQCFDEDAVALQIIRPR